MRIIASFVLLSFCSALHAREPRVQRDLPYAEPESKLQSLDVYAPAGGKNHPVVVWIHGGGWHSGDKKDVNQKPQAFVDKGFVFVSINYRLWPGATIKQIAEDTAKAIRWTHDHVAEHGGDPNTMFVMGHSAGAQLAALVCADERYLKAEKLSFAVIKGCVPVDGDTFDLPMRIATVHKSGNQKLVERDKQRFGDERLQKDLSSVTYIAKGRHIPPFLVLHVDQPEARQQGMDTKGQSERLFKALQEAGVPAKIYPAEGKNHQTLNDDLGAPGDKPTRALFEFLGGVLKK